MAARFWVGGTGTWDSAATTHWSATTGGASGASAPTSADDATFDANSGLTTSVVVTIAGTAACNNLTISGPAVKVCTFTLSGDFTISGALTLNGNSAVNRLLVQSNTVGTQRTITLATLTSLSNVDFQDIKTAGVAGTWTGTSLGDCQGNSGITFDAPTTQTYTDTGSHADNWSTLARWTSRVPLPQDNVLVPLGSTGTITGDMPRLGANVSFAGFTGTFNLTTAATAFGNWTFGLAMAHSASATLTLAGRGSQTLTSNGVHFSTSVIFAASAVGTYTLQDDLFVAPGANCTTNSGSLNTNGKNVTCWQFIFNPSATLTMTNSTITVTLSVAAFAFSVAGGATVNAAGSTVVISGAQTITRTFAGGGHVYGTLAYTVAGSTGALVITGANTFAAINFSDTTNARTLTLPASTTTTITQSFNVVGTSGKLMTVNSSTNGTTATLSAPAPLTMGCDYLSLQDITATGGAGWYAGPNSTIVSNVSGWTLTAPTITRGETSAAADAVSSLGLGTQGNIGDAATATDAVSGMALGTQGSITDTAAGIDAAASLALTAADAVTGSDAAWLGLSAADAALLTDTVSPLIPIDGIGDAASVDEMARLFDTLTLYETAAVSEALVLDADTTAGDGGSAVDLALPLRVLLTLADVAAAQDGVAGIAFSQADAGALTDALVSVVVLFTGSRGGSVVSKNRGGSVAAVTRGGGVHA